MGTGSESQNIIKDDGILELFMEKSYYIHFISNHHQFQQTEFSYKNLGSLPAPSAF
jgi:hypothetical protein